MDNDGLKRKMNIVRNAAVFTLKYFIICFIVAEDIIFLQSMSCSIVYLMVLINIYKKIS